MPAQKLKTGITTFYKVYGITGMLHGTYDKFSDAAKMLESGVCSPGSYIQKTTSQIVARIRPHKIEYGENARKED